MTKFVPTGNATQIDGWAAFTNAERAPASHPDSARPNQAQARGQTVHQRGSRQRSSADQVLAMGNRQPTLSQGEIPPEYGNMETWKAAITNMVKEKRAQCRNNFTREEKVAIVELWRNCGMTGRAFDQDILQVSGGNNYIGLLKADVMRMEYAGNVPQPWRPTP
jgi:hypothetical protein